MNNFILKKLCFYKRKSINFYLLFNNISLKQKYLAFEYLVSKFNI